MSVIERKCMIKSSDMSDDMQQDAIIFANYISIQQNVDRVIAAYVKKEFDRKYGPTWHCIAGTNFGGYLTHEIRNFIYFVLDGMAVLLWKSA